MFALELGAELGLGEGGGASKRARLERGIHDRHNLGEVLLAGVLELARLLRLNATRLFLLLHLRQS